MKDSKSNNTDKLVEYYLNPIKELFHLPGVTEIMVNRFDEIYIEQAGEIIFLPNARFEDNEAVRRLITQIGNSLGQPVDRKNPILDARLPDGNRVCAVLEPIAPNGHAITFRVFPKQQIDTYFLLEKGSLTVEMLQYLQLAILCDYNILVSGGTGSGKTSLLNVLSAFISEKKRVMSVEDTRELQFKKGTHHLPLEAPVRRPDKDSQKIDLERLIRTTLRKNPAKIIVGEIRDAMAASAFLQAINTGHNASSTIHANNPRDALARIELFIAGDTGLPFEIIKAQVALNINLIVQCEDAPRQGRRIVSITEIQEGMLTELWRWSYRQEKHIKGALTSVLKDRFAKYGIDEKTKGLWGKKNGKAQRTRASVTTS